jgi:hypothetical protein
MSSFTWIIDGEPVEIIFSLVRNGRWSEWQGRRVGVFFDYLDYNNDNLGSISISLPELEDLGEDVSQMLLQVLNLEAT